MSSRVSYYTFLFVLLAFFAGSCTGNKGEKKQEATAETTAVTTVAPVIGQETTLLLKDLETSGDYVNSQQFPSLIKASIVNEERGKNNLVIYLRPQEL